MSMPAPAAHVAATDAERFINLWYGDHAVPNLFAIHPTLEHPYNTRDGLTLVDAMMLNGSDGWNVYFHVNANSGKMTTRLKNADVDLLVGHQVDCDPPEGVEPNTPEYSAWLVNTIQMLKDAGATLIVFSGRGLAAYWKYGTPVPMHTDEGRERATRINRALRFKFNGDKAATDVARVMKLAGTTAYVGKGKEHWPVNETRIEHASGTTYDFLAFEQLALSGVPEDELTKGTKADLDILTDEPFKGYNGPADDKELVSRLYNDMMNPDFKAYWDKDETRLGELHPDGKRPFDASGADLGLFNLLAFWTGCNPARMNRLARLSALARTKWDDHPTYMAETIKTAIGDRETTRQYLGGNTYDPNAVSVADLIATTLAHPDKVNDLLPDVAKLTTDDRKAFIDETYKASDYTKAELGKAIGAHVVEIKKQATANRGLLYDPKGNPVQNMENIRRTLEHDPVWAGVFKHSEFDGHMWIMRQLPTDTGMPKPYPRKFVDSDAISVQSWMQSNGFPLIGDKAVWAAISSCANNNKYHQVKDYLTALRWDGQPRLGNMFHYYFHAIIDPDINGHEYYVQEASKRFCIGAVARIMDNGCKLDTMPTLSGTQGFKKSSGLEALVGPDWFGNDMPDVTHKDAKQWTNGVWIGEIAELASLRGKVVDAVKNFLSTRADKYRPSYGRTTIEHKRQTAFVGTVNGDDYLVDPTGNRRFWPVPIGAVARIDDLKIDRDQLWAEAVVMYNAGEKWWFDEGECPALETSQENARVVDVDEDKVREYLATVHEFTFSSTLADAIFDNKGDRTTSMRVAKYIKSCGWINGKFLKGNRKWVRGPKALPYAGPVVAEGNVTHLYNRPPMGGGMPMPAPTV